MEGARPVVLREDSGTSQDELGVPGALVETRQLGFVFVLLVVVGARFSRLFGSHLPFSGRAWYGVVRKHWAGYDRVTGSRFA